MLFEVSFIHSQIYTFFGAQFYKFQMYGHVAPSDHIECFDHLKNFPCAYLYLIFFFFPQALTAPELFSSPIILLFPDILKCYHRAYIFSKLPSFTLYNAFEILPCWCMYEYFLFTAAQYCVIWIYHSFFMHWPIDGLVLFLGFGDYE